MKAHRFSYQTFVGDIPTGEEINHKCRNKRCVEPTHLETLTRKQHLVVDRDILVRNGREQGHRIGPRNFRIAGLKGRKDDLPEGVQKHHTGIRARIWDPGEKKNIVLGRFPLDSPENREELVKLYEDARKKLSGKLPTCLS